MRVFASLCEWEERCAGRKHTHLSTTPPLHLSTSTSLARRRPPSLHSDSQEMLEGPWKASIAEQLRRREVQLRGWKSLIQLSMTDGRREGRC